MEIFYGMGIYHGGRYWPQGLLRNFTFLITTRQVCPYLILMKQFDSFMLTQLTTHGGMYYDFRSLPTTLVLLFVPTKSFTFYPFQVQAMDDFLP